MIMTHKIPILAFLGLAAAFLVASPANADLIHEWDADTSASYWHEVHVDVDKFSPFDHHHFEGGDSDFVRPLHDSDSGVLDTAEWIWWLNWEKDKKEKKEFGNVPDSVVSAPEPASLLLLGSGVLALGAWRRRVNHSASIS